MKFRNKIAALVGALALAVSMLPVGALAAPGDRPADTKIEVTGLDAQDTAKYYQVIEYDNATHNWKLTSAFANVDLTQTATNKATNEGRQADGLPALTTLDFILDGISAEEAGIIATAASASGGSDMTVTSADGSASATAAVDPGTYLVIVTPHENDTIYAPIFVSADYKPDGNTIDASNQSLSTPPVAVAKKSDLTIIKKSTGSTMENERTNSDGSVAVGSTVSFEVNTNVPTYTSNVNNATFKVSDKVSTGLQIQTGTLKVKVGSGSEQTVAAGMYYNVDGSSASADDYDFTVTKLTESEWEISFSSKYLTTEAQSAPAVVAKYDAKVTDAAATANVNELNNEAKIEYTHTPDGTTAHQEDETNHYTYSFDMPVAGNTSQNSSEFKKVGVDASGQAQYETFEVSASAPTGSNPLEGATFELVAAKSGETYTSTASDTNGLFSFKGLDAGRYTLKEKTAPAGYILDPTTYYVEIKPEFNADGTLKSYKVTCGTNSDYQNATVGSYTITNTGTGSVTAAKDTTDPVAYFKNIKTPDLPTTGGAGTLALTMGGVALIAAGFVLVMRVSRKADAE